MVMFQKYENQRAMECSCQIFYANGYLHGLVELLKKLYLLMMRWLRWVFNCKHKSQCGFSFSAGFVLPAWRVQIMTFSKR